MDLTWFAGKLTEKGLVHRQAADAILDRQGTTNLERACGLMKAVVAQVEMNEVKYNDFCSILQAEGTLTAVYMKLTKAYGKFPSLCTWCKQLALDIPLFCCFVRAHWFIV